VFFYVPFILLVILSSQAQEDRVTRACQLLNVSILFYPQTYVCAHPKTSHTVTAVANTGRKHTKITWCEQVNLQLFFNLLPTNNLFTHLHLILPVTAVANTGRKHKKITWREQVVLWFSGLRGVGGASALVTFVRVLLLCLLLRWCECSH
jgi:hypothetical protein